MDSYPAAIIDIDGVCFDPTKRLERCRKVDKSVIHDYICDITPVDLDDITLDDITSYIYHNFTPDDEEYFYIDWDKAFREVGRDPVIKEAPELVRRIAKYGYSIYYLTGRSDVGELATRVALSVNGFPMGTLGMRADGDKRPDAEVKHDMIVYYRDALGVEFEFAVDDDYNSSLGPMYEEQGIKFFNNLMDGEIYAQGIHRRKQEAEQRERDKAYADGMAKRYGHTEKDNGQTITVRSAEPGGQDATS